MAIGDAGAVFYVGERALLLACVLRFKPVSYWSALLIQPGVMSDSFPILHTHRLILRQLTHADAPRLFAIHSNRDAMRWFGSDYLVRPEQAVALIDVFAGWRLQPSPGTRWAIQRREDGLLLGTCGLTKWNRNWRTATLGYELAQDVWGKGYMGEALHGVLDWGFAWMELNRVEAQIHPLNAASITLAERLGFSREGLLREAGYWNGEFQDLLQYGLLRGDFRG